MYYAAGSKHHASIIFGITHKHNADRIGISFSIMLQNLSFIVFNETFYEKRFCFSGFQLSSPIFQLVLMPLAKNKQRITIKLWKYLELLARGT